MVPVVKGKTSVFRIKLSGDPGVASSLSVSRESGSEEITLVGGACLSLIVPIFLQ